jgi:Tfp pilus assembly protein PilW
MERRRHAYGTAGHPGAPLNRVTASAGSSLVELMISTLLLAILMAISYSFARAAFLSIRAQDAKSDAQEVMLMAVDLLTRELRLAGFSAAGGPLEAVRSAARERVEVAADFDGDGATDGPNELIAYSYNEEKRQLVRATGGASPQPLVRNVPPGGLRFTFFDASGSEIPSDCAMAADQRKRIHRIDAVLQIESPNADAVGDAPSVSTVSTSICLRNQPSEQ